MPRMASRYGGEEMKEDEAGCQGKGVQGPAQQDVAVKKKRKNKKDKKQQNGALEQTATPAVVGAERQGLSARHDEELQQL